MRRIIGALVALSLAAATAFAASTINPNVPAQNSDLNSAPLRNNFAAAYNDVNNILGMFAGTVPPANPLVGQYWRRTNVTPNIISQWDGAQWVPVFQFDTASHAVTGYVGNTLFAWTQLVPGLGASGTCLTSTGTTSVPTFQTCLSGATVNADAPITWDAGTLTIGIDLNSNFAVSGGDLALAPIGAGAVIANSTSGTAEPTGTTVTSLFDQVYGTGRGSIIFRGAAAWGALTAGTSGQILQTGGVGGDPSWVNIASSLTAGACISITGTTNATIAINSPATVACGGTGLTSGTSGGVPYFNSTSTMASSAALAANQLVLGGGAGAAPATLGSLGTSTQVLHGNAGGAPTWGAVNLGTDVTGSLALSSIASIANNTALCNVSGGAASPIACSATQVTTLVNAFTTTLSGAVPPPGSVSGNVLDDSGNWVPLSGGGTVTSVGFELGLDADNNPITGTGTARLSLAVNAQTGTTYTVDPTDCGKIVTLTNASPIAVTLPEAGGSGDFVAGCPIWYQNRGAGTVTITPTTSTVDGAASITLATSQGAVIFSDGSNYFTSRGRQVVSVTAGTGLTGGTITQTGTIAVDVASASDFQAGTANKVLTAANVFTTETTTSYGTTTAFDFNTFINTSVTLTGNITTMNCTNMKAGQAGTITFIQDATGSRTSVWCTALKFAGTPPTLSTAANAVDVLSYACRTTSFCTGSLLKNVQ